MKVTRLKRGYRISLSDVEYEMLNSLVVDGVSSREGDDASDEIDDPPVNRARERRQQLMGDHFGLLWVDEDRRDNRPIRLNTSPTKGT